MSAESRALRMFGAAAVVGLVHALPSLYWAFGGTWLLDTVGEWAVRLQAERPRLDILGMLLPVALVKAAGAVVPWLDHREGRPHRWVRVVSWCGVVVLVLWGGLGTLGAWFALATGAEATPAVLGHAFLWDPLFVAWGLLLGLALRRSRTRDDLRRKGAGSAPRTTIGP